MPILGGQSSSRGIDMPTTYHASRLNWMIANPQGETGGFNPHANVRPTSLFNSIGHAISGGSNSPSSLGYTFGSLRS